ncbi:hypothetical protein ACPEIC_41015 [Stenotrophomonas sp. NPDC087984]
MAQTPTMPLRPALLNLRAITAWTGACADRKGTLSYCARSNQTDIGSVLIGDSETTMNPGVVLMNQGSCHLSGIAQPGLRLMLPVTVVPA